jgi:hypothetical protein
LSHMINCRADRIQRPLSSLTAGCIKYKVRDQIEILLPTSGSTFDAFNLCSILMC